MIELNLVWLLHALVAGLSIVNSVNLCFWDLLFLPQHHLPPWPPWQYFRPQGYWVDLVDASPIAVVRIICSTYSWMTFIQCWAQGAKDLRFQNVDDHVIWIRSVLTICVFIGSSVLFLLVGISFLHMAISFRKYCLTVLSGDGRDVVNFLRSSGYASLLGCLTVSHWVLPTSPCDISNSWEVKGVHPPIGGI